MEWLHWLIAVIVAAGMGAAVAWGLVHTIMVLSGLLEDRDE